MKPLEILKPKPPFGAIPRCGGHGHCVENLYCQCTEQDPQWGLDWYVFRGLLGRWGLRALGALGFEGFRVQVEVTETGLKLVLSIVSTPLLKCHPPNLACQSPEPCLTP